MRGDLAPQSTHHHLLVSKVQGQHILNEYVLKVQIFEFIPCDFAYFTGAETSVSN